MNILRLDSGDAWIDAITNLWCQRLQQQPALRLGLTVEASLLPVFDAMAAHCRQGLVSFRQAEVFSLAEYGSGPVQAPVSWGSLMRKHLIERIDLPASQFHLMDLEEVGRNTADRNFEAALKTGLDLVLAAIGTDGHLCLNEPECGESSTIRRVILNQPMRRAAAKLFGVGPYPAWGVTVGLRQLKDAGELWLLAQGREKADVVRRVVQGEISTTVPASLMRKHPRSYIFVDHQAGLYLCDP
jgi:glucosamine-6-phosphate deaminase